MLEEKQAQLRRLVQKSGLYSVFARNVFSTLAVQLASVILALANSAIIARRLGPAGKGTLALGLLVPSLMSLFLNGGVAIANVYFAGSKRLDVPRLTANSVALTLMASAAGLILLALLTLTGWLEILVPGVPLWVLLLAFLTLPGALLNTFLVAILQGLQRILSVNLVTLVQSAATLVLTVLLVVGLNQGLAGAVVAALGASLAGLLVSVMFLRGLAASFRPRWDRQVLRTTLAFGLRGYVANVFQFFNYRLDTFLVNFFLGPAGVGIYGVSVALAELLWHLPNAVSFVIFPKAAATHPQEMNRFTPRVVRITLLITTVGAVVMALLGKLLIGTIYGSDFSGSYGPLLALLPGVVLLGGGKVLSNEITGRGYAHYNSINSGLAFVLTVILDLVLIPRYGVLGAAVASSAAYSTIFVTGIMFYLSVSRRSKPAAAVN